jgi:hypothetical protein
MNHPYILLNLWSYNTFDIPWLSNSEHITWGIVEETQDIKWNYTNLTFNPNITWEHISSTQSRSWYKYYFNKNPTIPREIWEKYSTPLGVDSNMSVRIEEILEYYSNYNAGMFEISNSIYKRKDLTLDVVLANKHLNWAYDKLCKNPNITWDLVLKHPELNWSFSSLCKNPNISLDIILNNKELDKITISGNPSITSYDVKSNPGRIWVYTKLCRRGILTYEMMKGICLFTLMTEMAGKYKNISISNPNNTWRTYYYNYKPCRIHGKLRFGKWNVAAKIQHVFDKWRKNVRVELSTQLLSREYMLCVNLPVELYHMISLLAIKSHEIPISVALSIIL